MAGITIYFLLLHTVILKAQDKVLVFENIFTGRKTELKAGDEVRLRFTVQDTVNAPFDVAVNDITVFGTIESISNNAIYLATKNKYFDRASIAIPHDGIESFRKYSPLRPIAKTGSLILSSALGLLATLQISESGDIVSWESAGLALAASSAVLMSKELFSDKMKFFVVEGWRPNVKLVK
ncbi:MAG: hypothetical protein IPO83_17395 [Chitinophagaceae bacterium]|nr:hypothetical protein [Chitinophagaceae bacterium]